MIMLLLLRLFAVSVFPCLLLFLLRFRSVSVAPLFWLPVTHSSHDDVVMMMTVVVRVAVVAVTVQVYTLFSPMFHTFQF